MSGQLLEKLTKNRLNRPTDQIATRQRIITVHLDVRACEADDEVDMAAAEQQSSAGRKNRVLEKRFHSVHSERYRVAQSLPSPIPSADFKA